MKAQESYLAGVVYSTCRIDFNCYLGPGCYTSNFDPGDGEVKVLNQSLPGYYSSMASMVNKIRHHNAVLANEYRRWMFEERNRKNIILVSALDPGRATC